MTSQLKSPGDECEAPEPQSAGLTEVVHRQAPLIREVFDLIPQIHRRELEARKEARSVRESPEFKLGKIITDKLRNGLGWFALPFRLRRAYKELVAAQVPPGMADGDSDETATIFFHAGKTSIGLPLTLTRQVVSVPAEEHGQAIWGTFLGASGASSATIEVGVPKDRSSSTAPAPAGKDFAEPFDTKRFELKVGVPVLLMDTGKADKNTAFHVRRTKGEFGLLKLDRIPHSDSAGATRPSSVEPAAFAVARGPGSAATPFAAAELERKLWGGYARYAVPELENLKIDVGVRTAERERAAWYLARWFFVEQDFMRALENIRYSAQLQPKQSWSRRLCEIQCLIKLGRFEQAHAAAVSAQDQYQEPDAGLIRATTVRHLRLSKGEPLAAVEDEQLAVINEFLATSGLAPIQKRNQELPLSLANLRSKAEPRTLEQNEKVSVVIPAYNAAESIEWVLDSLLEQTWRNLEIVVVDDFSSDGTGDIVEAVVKRDPRVRLIRKTSNEGAYPTRNTGMRAATGDLVMVHDSDDWSHPQRIELQLDALRSNPKLVATKSHWTRVSFDLEIWGAWRPAGGLSELNFTSLLFRRELLEKLGYWDDVRISGDAEFYYRLRKAFGEESVQILPKTHLLAFSLIRDNSLTRLKATHLRSLFYGLRWSYRDAYVFWHSRAAARKELPVLTQSGGNRPFPVPLGNRPGPKTTQHYQLLVIADFAWDDDAFRDTMHLIAEAGRRRLRIAAFHWQRYDRTCRTPLQPQFYEACLAHSIDIITPGDAVEADVVVIGCSSIIQYRIDPLPSITARKVVVCDERNASPTVHPHSDVDGPVAESHIESLFGTQPTWVKAGPGSAEINNIFSTRA